MTHLPDTLCGYRNIQMQTSYLNATKDKGMSIFDHKKPSVLQIQGAIEDAWSAGINSHGAIETGGIRFSRKFIGSPEVQTLFTHMKIP